MGGLAMRCCAGFLFLLEHDEIGLPFLGTTFGLLEPVSDLVLTDEGERFWSAIV